MSMSKEDFSIGIHLINAVCNKPITTNDTLEVYYSILKDLEFKTYKEAILKLIREKEFIGVPFSPAEIINAYNEISGKLLEIDRIIDILNSRESSDVAKWLKSFPNIKIVSRDGSNEYAKAIKSAHPNAIQINDRIHIIKNLTEYL